MSRLRDLSNKELLFDRQESFNDIISCLVAKEQGVSGYEKRLDGNLHIINVINDECKRRGFDPAMYQEETCVD